jgi:hypothetical protein
VTSAADPGIIGRAPFTDGALRDLFEHSDGRQWVAGHGGERVYGVWLMPPDEPVMAGSGVGGS